MISKALKKLEDLEFFLKKQNVSYPKSWNVIFKKESLKKRKPRLDTLWKNYRVYLYAKERLISCKSPVFDYKIKRLNELVKLSKKYQQNPKNKKLKEILMQKNYEVLRASYLFDGMGVEKKGGKVKYMADLKDKIFRDKFINLAKIEDKSDLARPEVIKKLKLLKHEKKNNLKTIIKFPNKIDTIEKILKNEFYWIQKERAFKRFGKINKSSSDGNDKSKFRKEKVDFYKCSMKIKDYNQDSLTSWEPEFKDRWTEAWGLFLKVR